MVCEDYAIALCFSSRSTSIIFSAHQYKVLPLVAAIPTCSGRQYQVDFSTLHSVTNTKCPAIGIQT